MPGIRIAPLEVEAMTHWVFQKPAIQRFWVLRAETWSERREDAFLHVAALIATADQASGLPDCDTDGWESELNNLVKPNVELTVIGPGTDPAGLVRGGVEIFRRQ